MSIDRNSEMELLLLKRIEKAIDNFGGMIKEYREKELLTLNSLASKIGCSGTYIFRAEKGTKKVPIHMRVLILKRGLNWKANEIDCYLVETIKRYEQKDR
ncbi:helix-turn-helix domain-containing protein [Oceanobacillus profundus]|uniref:hypothetical protein n=1 Tax=Oceanobacillus profundus TaxID=372463 RepID=UPI003636FB2E